VPPPKTPAISIVLPVHNQADHIERLVDAYRTALAALPATQEFVLVPNASRDASRERCEAAAAAADDVVVVPLAERGWGRAVRAGLAAARGDVLCYTNSARTTPEMLSLTLMFAVAYPGTVVKTNRKTRDSRLRRLGSLLYNLECRALFGLGVWDVNGTPKVFPRAFGDLLDLTRDDDLLDIEFLAVCKARGYRVVEIPMLENTRHGGRSTTNLRSALALYRGAVQLRQSRGG
jgi:glycosyltransferase involved in cell wall biosynthesis